MRWFAAAALSLALVACADDEEAAPTSTGHGRGITAELPDGWHASRIDLMPHLVDPRPVFVAATFPVRYRETECAHVPGSALEDLGPRDAFIDLEERGRGGASMPPRPAEFGPSLGGRSEAGECVPRARFRDRWFEFEDAGRRFHVRVAFGPEATAETQDEAWSILDSLRIDPAVTPDWPNAESGLGRG